MIEITDSPDTKQWSDFVHNHPHGNIFQTPEMAECINEQRIMSRYRLRLLRMPLTDREYEECA
jgi:hypothetical protein